MQGIGSGVASAQPAPEVGAQQGVSVEDQTNVTPEEQAAYDEFVNNGMEIMYPQGEQAQVSPVVAAHLQGQFEPEIQQLFAELEPPLTPSPVDNVAATATVIVLTLEASASEANHEISDDVIMHGGTELIEQLIEVAEAMGISEFDEQSMEGVLYRAMDMYRIASPRADTDALSQEFGQITEADKAGTLDQLLPGIGERMKAQG